MRHSNAPKYETVVEAGRSKPSKEKEEEEEEEGEEEEENEGKKKKKKKKKKKEKKNDDEDPENSSSNNAYLAVEPPNGGWGWVVVLSAFYCNIVVDGIQLAFGVFLKPISKDLDAGISEIALAGSLMFGVHLLMGPVCAGCNAVFGLRPVAVTGSLICSLGIGISYFSTGYWFLYFSFGILGGIGLGLVYMNTLVITSLYFTTLMPLAIAIVVCGTGVGTMVFAALGNFLLGVTTWQNSFLMQAALAGSMSLVALTFKPLKPSRVKIATDENAPDEQESSSRRRSVFVKTDLLDRGSIITIRNFQSLAVSFAETKSVSEYGDTRCFCSRCCRQKKQQATNILVLKPVEEGDPETRRKSYVEKVNRRETIEEEEIAVTLRKQSSHQVYARIDLRKQRTKNFWLTLKRTLVFMLDCRLLRSFSFFLFTMSSAINLASCLIVFIYEKDRVETLGFSKDTSVNFIITLGGATVFWRLLLGALSLIPKIHYLALTVSGMILGGIGAVASGYYTNIYFQYGFCILFSLGMASFAVFRIPLLIDLVGIELVENATGINLLFMGIACIVFPPFFGWIMEVTKSYNVIFAITGTLIVLSALSLVRLKKVDMEAIKKSNKTPKRRRHVLRSDKQNK